MKFDEKNWYYCKSVKIFDKETRFRCSYVLKIKENK